MVADKGNKTKLQVKGVEENSEQIDSALLFPIEKLPEIQDELDKINEEASDKVLEVEQKYNEIRKPFLCHPVLGELLTEEDQKTFKHISSIEVEDFKDLKSGYFISFNFNPNPFFEDTKHTKTFTFLDEGLKITATQIKWKKDNGLPNGANHEKKGNKRQFAEESFFMWFTDAQQKDGMDGIHDVVAEIIKEELWPNPLTYFTNVTSCSFVKLPKAGEEDFEGDGDEEGKDDD
ncbi:NAP1-related protein 2 [Hibiscus syriacus]|uniref:NAP1-related protein 2 n=1 Tax=Hibiscus syriacus TaxID=106335 RepID=A0A6A2ZQS9_HIBSY|nr:NAP1-related protein 2 [Hibiscus syriacus]